MDSVSRYFESFAQPMSPHMQSAASDAAAANSARQLSARKSGSQIAQGDAAVNSEYEHIKQRIRAEAAAASSGGSAPDQQSDVATIAALAALENIVTARCAESETSEADKRLSGTDVEERARIAGSWRRGSLHLCSLCLTTSSSCYTSKLAFCMVHGAD